jgi:hypothetical protein
MRTSYKKIRPKASNSGLALEIEAGRLELSFEFVFKFSADHVTFP